MKRITLLVAFALVFCGSVCAQPIGSRAYRQSYYKNEFFLSPFYFFDGTFALGYQRNMGTVAISLMPSVTLKGSFNGGDPYPTYDVEEAEGFGLEGTAKVFFQRMPRKVQPYVGPYIGYRFLNEKNGRPEDLSWSNSELFTQYNIMNVGVLFGVHFMFGRFTMDVNLGGGIRYPSISGVRVESQQYAIPDDLGEIGFKGVVPKGNLTFGIAF